jgi:hypothetical protein
MAGTGSGKSGINNLVGGGGGLSGMDFGLLGEALGLGTTGIHNRYEQLGIGVPSGDPASAAASGSNLTYSGPSTMETTDIGGLGSLAQAALGQLQVSNINNPAIPGSPANIGQGIQQNAQQTSQGLQDLGFAAGLAGA